MPQSGRVRFELDLYGSQVVIVDPGDTGSRRSLDGLSKIGLQLVDQMMGGPLQFVLLPMLQGDPNDPSIRRVMKGFSLLEFALVEAWEIEMEHILQDGVGRFVGLDQYQAMSLFSSRSSCYLHHHLEAPFRRTKIRVGHQLVSLQDPDQSEMFKVQAFDDHLSADQYIQFLCAEILQDACE